MCSIIEQKKKDIRLGIYLPSVDLFDAASSRVNRTQKVEYAKITQYLIQKLAELSKSENIMTVNDEANKLDLIKEIERLRDKYEIEERRNTIRFYYYTNKHLTEFFRYRNKEVRLNVRDIDDIFLDVFCNYLRRTYGMKSITISGYLHIMFTIFNIVTIRNKTKIFSPFTKYKLKKDEEDFSTLKKKILNIFRLIFQNHPLESCMKIYACSISFLKALEYQDKIIKASGFMKAREINDLPIISQEVLARITTK